MREVVGFVAGLTAGVAGTIFVGTETGRRLRERLANEAEPDLRTALEEWDPLLREVARAVRLTVRELEQSAERAARFVADLADDEGLSDGELATGSAPGLRTAELGRSPRHERGRTRESTPADESSGVRDPERSDDTSLEARP